MQTYIFPESAKQAALGLCDHMQIVKYRNYMLQISSIQNIKNLVASGYGRRNYAVLSTLLVCPQNTSLLPFTAMRHPILHLKQTAS